jgi:hypothetical protein
VIQEPALGNNQKLIPQKRRRSVSGRMTIFSVVAARLWGQVNRGGRFPRAAASARNSAASQERAIFTCGCLKLGSPHVSC